MAHSEYVSVLVLKIVEVNTDVLEVNLGMVEEHANRLSFPEAIVVIETWERGGCLIHWDIANFE
jgi:hypothetical protein